jgi:hypothetical protein
LKKPNRTETEKNPEKNRAKLEKKPSPTGLNRFVLKKPNRTETGWFEPVSVFFKKNNFGLIFFLIKTELNRK